MKLIDLHCDTLWKLWRDRRDSTAAGNDLLENEYCVSIPGMRDAGTLVQFFACFTYLEEMQGGYEEAYEQVIRMMDILLEECEKYSDTLAPAYSYKEVLKNEKDGKISAMLTVEEGGILNGRLERLEVLYNKGMRLITPMWNYENCFGFPNSRETAVMERGLKDFGIEAVELAGNLGIIVDVSHASDGTFRDILKYAKGPVVASHSNCRAISRHPRNLSDEMIRMLADAGGVAGLNFYGPFLGNSRESRLEEMTKHIQHMIRVGGEEFPAIGTDLDGFDGMEYQDIPRIEYIGRLWERLKKSGIAESVLDRIWRRNAENVLKRMP